MPAAGALADTHIAELVRGLEAAIRSSAAADPSVLSGLSAELHRLGDLAASIAPVAVQGWLLKQGQKSVGGFKRRYFVLRPDEHVLAYCK